jgi:hypothetical protein
MSLMQSWQMFQSLLFAQVRRALSLSDTLFKPRFYLTRVASNSPVTIHWELASMRTFHPRTNRFSPSTASGKGNGCLMIFAIKCCPVMRIRA